MAQQRLAARWSGRPPTLKVGYAAGAGANTNITLTGIKPGDEIVSALELQPPTAGSGAAIANDRTAATSITAANTIQCTSATTGNQLLVIYYSV
jgi:hypothetical protein